MATYKDSVGNTYTSLPQRKPSPGSKKTRNKIAKRHTRKNAQEKYLRYRRNVGKPNGPGQPGNKSGHNKITR